MDLSKLADHELAAQACEGREPAYRELLERYERPVFSFIYRMVRGRRRREWKPVAVPSQLVRGQLDLTLSGQVPMDLELEFGAVQANLDLGGLRLRSLDLSTGASEAELRVSAPNPEPM